MKKYITSVLLLSTGLIFASAEISDVDTSSDNSCAIITSNLRYLSRDANGSTNVFILQDFLSAHGYLKSQPTGFFGSATRKAVIAFQNDYSLRSTPPGFVGAGTRAKIQAIDCNDTSDANTVVNKTSVTKPVIYNNVPTYILPATQVINNTQQYPTYPKPTDSNPLVKVVSVKSLDDFPYSSTTWRTQFYPSGAVPLDEFKAFYFNTSEPSKIVASAQVASVDMSYAWEKGPGFNIVSQDFGGYWIGDFMLTKDEDMVLDISQSWSETRVIIDGHLVYKGGSNTSTKISVPKGRHTIEIEYVNNWHTVGFFSIAPSSHKCSKKYHSR